MISQTLTGVKTSFHILILDKSSQEAHGIYLLVQVAVVLYDSDPLQHVLSVLGLEQILAVRRGQPQHVLPLGVTVGDVNQAGFDADWQGLVYSLAVCISMAVLLVFI